MKKLLLLCMLSAVWLFGCGNVDDTSGTLTMSEITATDLSGGRYRVESTATYLPDGGKVANGVVINFTAVYSTTLNTETRKSDYMLGTSGIATYLNDSVFQGNEPVYLRLTASYGGLSQSKTITIPALP